jgi:hypothetical protein
MGKAGRIIAMAAAHHRFNYIHPFADGNGRVSRLMSHAMAWKADVAAHGLWSISRGLARGLNSRSEYNQMMDLADRFAPIPCAQFRTIVPTPVHPYLNPAHYRCDTIDAGRGSRPQGALELIRCLNGERGRNRTFNLLIKSQLLCQLSYAP